jgi:hypothetical protein
MERYTMMYPHGQPGLPDDSVTAYVNNHHAISAASRSTMNRRTQTTRLRDRTRECNVFVASTSSSSEPEPTPRHRAADAQRRARLDELDKELALPHQDLGMDTEPRDRWPAQDILVQEEPHEWNGERRERYPAAEQSRARAPTPLARGSTRDKNQRANEGANVDTNADADTSLVFRRALQNLAATAMLLRGCLEAATSEER